MDNLNERLAVMIGRRPYFLKDKEGEVILTLPQYDRDPLACAELDEYMRGKGFILRLDCFRTSAMSLNSWNWNAHYMLTGGHMEWSEAPTECRARALAAEAALIKLREAVSNADHHDSQADAT